MGRTESRPTASSAPDALADRKKLRKRELDRISQQRKRQKDRETICRLRSQLQSLQEPAETNQLSHLIAKLQEEQTKVQKQKDRMKEMQVLLQASLDDLQEDHSATRPGCPLNEHGPQISNQNSTTEYTDVAQDLANPVMPKTADPDKFYTISDLGTIDFDGISWNDSSETALLPLSSIYSAKGSALQTFTSGIPGLPLELDTNAAPDWTVDMIETLSDCSPPPAEELQRTSCGSVWKTTDEQLSRAREHYQYDGDIRYHSENDDDGDTHMILMGVLEGWDKAARNFRWNRLWQCLAQIDQACFRLSGIPERLCVMWTLFRMFKFNRYVGDPRAAALPIFLQPRPCQLNIPHSVVADYFVWPGLREHMIFNYRKYSHNAFSREFELEVRFMWPYEVRDLYVRNRETKLYEFSKMFLERADDLRCFCLNSSFVAKYPEFRGDVPIYDPAPHPALKLPAHSPNAVWQHFFPVFKAPATAVESEQSEDVDQGRRLRLTGEPLSKIS